jgi:hypothetical protein
LPVEEVEEDHLIEEGTVLIVPMVRTGQIIQACRWYQTEGLEEMEGLAVAALLAGSPVVVVEPDGLAQARDQPVVERELLLLNH